MVDNSAAILYARRYAGPMTRFLLLSTTPTRGPPRRTKNVDGDQLSANRN
jgi:hypothetical protein